MALTKLTSIARLPLALIRHVEQFGVDPEDIFRAAGVTDAHRRDPDSRVSFETLLSVWHAILDRVPHEAVGLRLGAAFRVRELGLVGYAMHFSATMGEALDRLIRYVHIVSMAAQFVTRLDGKRLEIALEAHPLLDALRHPIDTRLAFLVTVARELSGHGLRPLEVRFSYRRPSTLAEHIRVFGDRLLFDQPQTVLVVSSDERGLPIVAADATLAGYLENLADDVKRSLDWETDFDSRVRRAIWSELIGGRVTRPTVAARLGLSVSSLHRRLRHEGASFAGVLEEFRRELATELLQSRNIAIEEIAFVLGYSEASTFHRAFRRWKGITPREYRLSHYRDRMSAGS